jgi:hypothetical protein
MGFTSLNPMDFTPLNPMGFTSLNLPQGERASNALVKDVIVLDRSRTLYVILIIGR